MFVSKDILMKHKKEKHYKQRLCNFYHKHGNCRFGDQCLNKHENNSHMQLRHGPWQSQMKSNIECKNGVQSMYKTQNRCNFKHSAQIVTNDSGREHNSLNTNFFDIGQLMESLGARLEKMEQNVPNFQFMTDFPLVEESRSKQKNCLKKKPNRRALRKHKRKNSMNNSQIVFYANNCNKIGTKIKYSTMFLVI